MNRLSKAALAHVRKRAPGGPIAYELKKGENPSIIAKRFGVSLASLMKLNNLTDASARKLKVGQSLLLKEPVPEQPKAAGPVKGKYVGRGVDPLPFMPNEPPIDLSETDPIIPQEGELGPGSVGMGNVTDIPPAPTDTFNPETATPGDAMALEKAPEWKAGLEEAPPPKPIQVPVDIAPEPGFPMIGDRQTTASDFDPNDPGMHPKKPTIDPRLARDLMMLLESAGAVSGAAPMAGLGTKALSKAMPGLFEESAVVKVAPGQAVKRMMDSLGWYRNKFPGAPKGDWPSAGRGPRMEPTGKPLPEEYSGPGLDDVSPEAYDGPMFNRGGSTKYPLHRGPGGMAKDLQTPWIPAPYSDVPNWDKEAIMSDAVARRDDPLMMERKYTQTIEPGSSPWTGFADLMKHPGLKPEPAAFIGRNTNTNPTEGARGYPSGANLMPPAQQQTMEFRRSLSPESQQATFGREITDFMQSTGVRINPRRLTPEDQFWLVKQRQRWLQGLGFQEYKRGGAINMAGGGGTDDFWGDKGHTDNLDDVNKELDSIIHGLKSINQSWNPQGRPISTTRHAAGGATGLPKIPTTKGVPPQSIMVSRAAGAGMARKASGFLHSAIPGRTDKLSLGVQNGSYVVPADVVAGHGQGNSLAGAAALDKLFKSGPYGSRLPRLATPRGSMPKVGFIHPATTNTGYKRADGGETDGEVPVMAAGGEYIIEPEAVNAIGGGNPERGFRVLDKFVLNSRKKQVKEIRGLAPPKKD